MMKYLDLIARPWRIPLAGFLSCVLLATTGTTWSIYRTAEAEVIKEQTRRERLARSEILAHQETTTEAVSAGMARLEELNTRHPAEKNTAMQFKLDFALAADIDIDSRIAPTNQEDPFWRSQTIRLRLEIPHEGHLLDALSTWRNTAPGLHQVRSCMIERLAQALQADCQLTRLLLPEASPR